MDYWAKAGVDRHQTLLMYPTLDESVSDDHPVRRLDEILRARKRDGTDPQKSPTQLAPADLDAKVMPNAGQNRQPRRRGALAGEDRGEAGERVGPQNLPAADAHCRD